MRRYGVPAFTVLEQLVRFAEMHGSQTSVLLEEAEQHVSTAKEAPQGRHPDSYQFWTPTPPLHEVIDQFNLHKEWEAMRNTGL